MQPLKTNAEIVTVSAISTDTLTIVRAQEGSSARTVVIGDQIAATITAKTLTDDEGTLSPATDQQIQPNYCTVVAGRYTIASGKRLTIGSAGRLKVL